ncbi:MAG: tetratricopeptide repeat protein [Bacteroidia bacterium]|nr:tetratricopeptide repeat protein [Bacteroidia bacterium]MCF8425438.1 tetratricopeptide repeat protein [Bacteroidia bacterium]MCF8446280.1 tetratricopeptide repeat protein [Bacteroidia bacterium]
MQFNKAQIIIIAVLLGLVGILVYLNYKSSTPDVLPDTSMAQQPAMKAFDFTDYLSHLKDSVSEEMWASLNEQTQQANSPEARIYEIAGLSAKWDSLGYKLVGAHYFAKVASRLNDENSWYNSGLKFYEFAATCQDTSMQIYASRQAIEAFEKVVVLNENNVDAKNALAICYIQNDLDIMKGVQLLKDVTKRDSNNLEANYTLGMLSMRSGQVDKAAARFETLVRIQPMNAEFHYYLGEAYAQMGKKNEAIKAYETFKGLVPDEEAKKNIDISINNLKNSN